MRAKDLHDYDDTERSITYRTFVKHVGVETIRELNSALGYSGSKLSLKNDWAVSYGKGKWRGRPAVCMHHSSIHHIWTI